MHAVRCHFVVQSSVILKWHVTWLLSNCSNILSTAETEAEGRGDGER